MSRVILIHAGPTPWDEENRLVGNHSLPLSSAAASVIDETIQGLPLLSAIYVDKTNEAAITVGKMLAKRFNLRTRHDANLAEVNLGLWQGLDRPTLRTRFESSFPQWEEQPITITPPQGESIEHAIDRLRLAIQKIAKRNRGLTVAIPVRPLAMQILLGILKNETPAQIGEHLGATSIIETIDLPDEKLAGLAR